MSWLNDLLTEINQVDLTKPQIDPKVLTKDDLVIGDLSEYQQKFFRVREKLRDIAEDALQAIYDLQAVHNTQYQLASPSHESSMAEQAHQTQREVLMRKFVVLLLEYARVDVIFWHEIEQDFKPEDVILLKVKGIRNGATYVTRNDNRRGDRGQLDELIADSVQGDSASKIILAFMEKDL